MKSSLLGMLAFAACFGCRSVQFSIHKSSDLGRPAYTRSFAIVVDENLSSKSLEAIRVLKMGLIESKWIYDHVDPDVLVVATTFSESGRLLHCTIRGESDDQILWYKNKLNLRKSSVLIRFLEADSYRCIWQGVVTDLPKNTHTFTYQRAVSSLIQ